nr:TldD/PmbA family protein [Thermococcus profundus]
MEAVDALIGILERKNLEWEIYWESGRSGSFRIERERLERSQRKFFSGIGLRVGINGRTGFSYVTGLTHDRETLEGLVKRAEKLAKVGSVPFRGFPSVEGKLPAIKGLYDSRIEEMPFEEAYEMAEEYSGMMAELKEKKGREYTFSGGLGLAFVKRGLVNSNGVEVGDGKTGLSLWAYAVRKGNGSGNGYHSQSYTGIDGFDEAGKIITKALDDADASYSAKKLEPFSGEVLIEHYTLQSLVYLFLENLYGESVYYGRSRFSTENIGDEVTSEKLTIIDDPTVEGSPGSYPFDGEGSPGRGKELISGGKLRNFLLDHTYGSLLGLGSTGNAVRDFRTVPHIGTSNILVGPGEEGLEDWDGVIVSKVFGEHTANPVSGDFSLTVELGYSVRNGEITPFRGNMIAGNVFKVLKRVSRVGKEMERSGAFYGPRVASELRIV